MNIPGDIATRLSCTQCGGELHPDEGQSFLTCPYCSATVYVDKARVVFHWTVSPTLSEQQAIAALYRWMSGSQTVKDLDKKAKVTGQAFQYFPIWYFKWNTSQGEQETLRPAAATAITELSSMKLPAGDLKRYDTSIDSLAVSPTVPIEAAMEWEQQGSVKTLLPGKRTIQETAIVHVPVYFYQYTYASKTYTAVVDAASGMVMANLFPPKAEAPYLAVGLVTALVYLCLATLPLFAMAGSSPELWIAAFLVIGMIVTPILFGWAFWVASKV